MWSLHEIRMEPHRPRPADAGLVHTLVIGVGLALASAAIATWMVRRRPHPAPVLAPAPVVDASPGALAAVPDAGAPGDASVAPAWTGKLNVVLVTIDTLRSDIGYAGYPRPVTPNLDALAARSVVFDRAYSTAPYTMKALMALLTGRFTSEARRDFQHYTHYYPENVFLAERVQASGARTVGVMCHRYFGLKPGFEQGFDVFDLSATPPNMTDSDPRSTSPLLTDVSLRLLGRQENTPTADRPLFAWIHYFDPHAPYVSHPGAPAFGSMDPTSPSRSRDVYDAEVWFTDAHVGRLLDWIAKAPWADRTAIIVTADHGEAFGEKGHYHHGRELWEPLVHVPLMIHLPGIGARHVPIKRSHIDVVPTILDLMGIPEGAPKLRGKSLVPDALAAPGAALEERDVFLDAPEGQMNEPRRGILTGPTPGTKLVARKGHVELYDLAADPEEAHDIAKDAARLAPVQAAFDAYVSGLDEVKPVR